MSRDDGLVEDESEYNLLREEQAAVFHDGGRLPDDVFRKRFRFYTAIEHGITSWPAFPRLLKHLGTTCGDTRITYVTIEPGPIDYYLRYVGAYGAARFTPTDVEDGYMNAMRRGGKTADCFDVRGGDVAAIWGDSGKWAAFSDRISWELCLIGSDVPLRSQVDELIRPGYRLPVASYVHGLYSWKPEIGEHFCATFEANFPSVNT